MTCGCAPNTSPRNPAGIFPTYPSCDQDLTFCWLVQKVRFRNVAYMKRTNAWVVAATVGISALAIGSAIAANTNVFTAAKTTAPSTQVAAQETVIVDATVPVIPSTIVRYDDVYVYENAADSGVPVPTVPDTAGGAATSQIGVSQPRLAQSIPASSSSGKRVSGAKRISSRAPAKAELVSADSGNSGSAIGSPSTASVLLVPTTPAVAPSQTETQHEVQKELQKEVQSDENYNAENGDGNDD
jgi:hypothetical protein